MAILMARESPQTSCGIIVWYSLLTCAKILIHADNVGAQLIEKKWRPFFHWSHCLAGCVTLLALPPPPPLPPCPPPPRLPHPLPPPPPPPPLPYTKVLATPLVLTTK